MKRRPIINRMRAMALPIPDDAPVMKTRGALDTELFLLGAFLAPQIDNSAGQ